MISLTVIPRYLMFVGVLGASLLLVDFLVRVYVPLDANSRRFDSPEVTPLSIGVGVAGDPAQALREWFPLGASEVDQAPNEIVLQGVFRMTGEPARVAIVVRSASGQVMERRLIGAGEIVDGWRVEKIGRDRATLIKDESGKEMVLFQHGLESQD